MRHRSALVAMVLGVLILLLTVLGICIGSVRISVSDILGAIFRPQSVGRNTAYIVLNIRMPRVLCAIAAGSALALCGVVFQSVFRNPMADSYVLGVSSGASLAVGLGFVLGIGIAEIGLPLVAFSGSMLTTTLLFAISRRSSGTLLLSGIAMNFLLSAMTTLTIYLSGHQADSILFWTLGSLGNIGWPRLIAIIAVTAVAAFIVMGHSNAMDILLLDDSTAISSGVNIKATRIILLAVCSIVTATVVCFCGIIGFVGMMSPHFVRLLVGPKHSRLVPLSMMLGSSVLLFSDMVCRFIVAPSELPIGIVTSILGAPVFLMLLRSKSHAR